MNELAKVSRNAGRQVVELPEGFEIAGDSLRVRRDGRNLVLEPIPGDARIAPGSYTAETLPPLSDGARKILASLDSAAPLVAMRGAEKSADGGSDVELEDDGVGIDLSDEGLSGIDPGR